MVIIVIIIWGMEEGIGFQENDYIKYTIFLTNYVLLFIYLSNCLK